MQIMSEIAKRIQQLCPSATFEDAQTPTFNIPLDQFRNCVEHLRHDPDLDFDFLECMSGVDWGERIGVVYRLRSFRFARLVTLICTTTDRQKPELPSVCHLWTAAAMNEREIYDFFGIRFVDNPDMRRLFLRNDWQGYPLRKDYDRQLFPNPIPQASEPLSDEMPTLEWDALTGEVSEKMNLLFEKEDYVVNIGPQHPATHGVLHFQVSLEGEIVKKIDVHCGYIHRGIEKMCEDLTYPQCLALTDRLDYLSAHPSRHALCSCIENALGMEVPERAVIIRMMMDELSRIQSHLLFFSCLCMDMGGLTPFFYGFRDREIILDIFEKTTGGRLIQNYNMIGGVAYDLHPDFEKDVRALIEYLPRSLRDYHKVFTNNVIARQRLKGVGILPKEMAISYAVSGPVARASGFTCDLRKHQPYARYDQISFNEVLYTNGDSLDRYLVRIDEIQESLHILEQLLSILPQGSILNKPKPVIKLPIGRYYQSVEGVRGIFGVYIESRGEKSPYRMKFRSTGLPLVSLVDPLSRNTKIADLIAIGGTLDYVVPDIDR